MIEQANNLSPINMDKDGKPTDGRGDWKQFLCRACGWIYDEKIGDPDGGLPAGTRFEDIPDDWQCPLCGVTKRDFEPFTPTQHQHCQTASQSCGRYRRFVGDRGRYGRLGSNRSGAVA